MPTSLSENPLRRFATAALVALLFTSLACLPVVQAQTASWQPFVPFTTSTTTSGTNYDAASVAQAISNVPRTAGIVFDGNGEITNTQIWNLGTNAFTGIVNVGPTLERIRRGFSVHNHERDDGQFFNFRNQNQLTNIPRVSNNYYMEFMVWPGEDMDFVTEKYNINALPYGQLHWPGSMRLIVGLGGEVYFSGDHYGESGPQQFAYYVNPVPEPSTLGLLGLGACLAFALMRRAGRS